MPPEHSRTSCIELLRDLRDLLEACSEHDCVILLGDFNVHLPRNYGKVTGQFSAERQAARGRISLKQRDILRLLSLHGLCVINMFFRPKKRQTVHTWRGNNLYKRRQLDYIMVSARWRSSFTDSKVQWSHSRLLMLKGKKSDHGLLLAKFRWRLGKRKRKQHINWRALKPVMTVGDDARNVNPVSAPFEQGCRDMWEAAGKYVKCRPWGPVADT